MRVSTCTSSLRGGRPDHDAASRRRHAQPPLPRVQAGRTPILRENARSVGLVLPFGRFSMLDLGDLTWNNEHDLVCPNNLLGMVDVYLTTHHGVDLSGPAVLVHAVQPRVAVMNNGPKKGGMPSAGASSGLARTRGSVAAPLRGGRRRRPQRGGELHREPRRHDGARNPPHRAARRPVRRDERPQRSEQDLSTAPRPRGTAVSHNQRIRRIEC